MRMFNDIFSGCTVASDAFPLEEVYNGAAIKFTAKFITKKEDLGGIPDAEGDDENAEGETVIDVVDAYNLHTVEGYKVKEWLAMVKGLMKKIMENVKGELSAEDMKSYKKGCVEFVNFIKNTMMKTMIEGKTQKTVCWRRT